MKRNVLIKKYTVIISVTSLLFMSLAISATAGEIDELKQKISDRTSKINGLEEEIDKYENELVDVGKEKNSLQNAIKTLDISQNKINANINVTENRVGATSLQISKLALEIGDKEEKISLHNETIAQNIRSMNELEDNTFVETILTYDNISELWDHIENIQSFQEDLQNNLSSLKSLKVDLEDSKHERETRRKELINYNQDLKEQNKAVEVNKQNKAELLSQTKNKESNYINLIEEKKAARALFEKELLNFESQLKIAIDPDSIPNARPGVLLWPLDAVTVTQYFGNTEFAKSGAYKGKGHNGVDFRAAPGTQVKTALSGTVLATGNTDEIPGCYSYGKWVVIRHNNGLSSLYAHLSHISVSKDSVVVTGQTIGYSGNTGYSTGPHLHFSLFASQGVRIVKLGSVKTKTNCAEAYVPVAPHEAYLNPLSYF